MKDANRKIRATLVILHFLLGALAAAPALEGCPAREEPILPFLLPAFLLFGAAVSLWRKRRVATALFIVPVILLVLLAAIAMVAGNVAWPQGTVSAVLLVSGLVLALEAGTLAFALRPDPARREGA